MELNKIKTNAFTLIELLVVIAIIGILSGLIIVGMNSSINSATIAKAQIFSASLRDSLLMNLISEWKFDGSGIADGGTATNVYTRDTWSNNNTLLISGTPYIRSGSNCISGSCLQLTDGYLYSTASNINPGTGSYTIEGWTLATDYTYPRTRFPMGGYSAPLSGIPCWNIENAYSASSINITFYDGTTRVDSTINCDAGYRATDTINKWTHVAISFNRTAGKVYAYVNGVKQSGSVDISSVTGNVYNIQTDIGYSVGWRLYGKLDNVRIYSAAISSSQIKEIYYSGINSLLAKEKVSVDDYGNKIKEL